MTSNKPCRPEGMWWHAQNYGKKISTKNSVSTKNHHFKGEKLTITDEELKKKKKNKKFLAVRYFLQEMLKRFLLSEIETLESNWNPYDKIKSSLVTLAETTYINIKIKYKCVLFHTTAGCKFYSCFHKL